MSSLFAGEGAFRAMVDVKRSMMKGRQTRRHFVTWEE